MYHITVSIVTELNSFKIHSPIIHVLTQPGGQLQKTKAQGESINKPRQGKPRTKK
jgi:hypothetical protein